jgi:hypothetical protein
MLHELPVRVQQDRVHHVVRRDSAGRQVTDGLEVRSSWRTK